MSASESLAMLCVDLIDWSMNDGRNDRWNEGRRKRMNNVCSDVRV